MIEIMITPTARCDRGCSHCEFASTMSGESISPRILSTFPREFRRLGVGEKRLCITGGGEPLLYPWTPKLIWEVMGDKRNWVDFVTSGCKDENDSGYGALKLITDAFRSARLASFLSYNGYNPTADERLRFSLPLLRKVNGLVCIKVAMSYQDRSPMERLDGILQELGYKRKITLASHVFSPRYMRRLTEPEILGEEADFSEQVYFRENDYEDSAIDAGYCGYTQQIVSVKPQNLLIEGRAENIAPTFRELRKHTTLRRRCHHLRDERDQLLFIDHTGSIYPCCMETPTPNANLLLGSLGETPLWEAMAGREKLMSLARRQTLLSSKGLCSNPCGYCGDNRTGA